MKNPVKHCLKNSTRYSTNYLEVSNTESYYNKVSIIMLPVKRYCNMCLNQPERLYDRKLLYGHYLCLCMCILYVEWPARARAEAG